MGFFDVLAAPFNTVTGIASNIISGLDGTSAKEANSANQASADKAMQFAQDSADKQMAFQERMSGSAYQRAMSDMKTAGLNPLLAFSQGGASTPSGSSASGVSANNQDVGSAGISNAVNLTKGVADGVSLAPAIAKMHADTQVASAQAATSDAIRPETIGNVRSQTALNNSTAILQANQAKEIAARLPSYRENLRKTMKEIEMLSEATSSKKYEALERKRDYDFYNQNPSLWKVDRTMKSIKGALDAGKTGSEIINMLP